MTKKSMPLKIRFDRWLDRHVRIVISLILVITIAVFSYMTNRQPSETGKYGNEIQQILATKDLKTQVRLYKALINRVGPEQAQDELYRSGLPFTGESHLLNHTVGDYIYEQYGASGITKCRNYFLESCYHGLLLHVIGGNADKDLEDVKLIMEHCESAGPTVSAQCAHGIGHGYVAAVGYANLDRGLAQCDALAVKLPNFPHYNCLDGAFMENVWAVHEGEPSPDRWVNENDDLYPCNDPRLTNLLYGDPCWSNQPSLLYQRHQGNLRKVGEICENLTPETIKTTCFNGLSRQIHPLTENKIDRVFALCGELPLNWQQYCRNTNVVAAYSVGDRSMPFELCTRESGDAQAACYNSLIGSIHGSTRDTAEMDSLCRKLPETNQAPRLQCLDGIPR